MAGGVTPRPLAPWLSPATRKLLSGLSTTYETVLRAGRPRDGHRRALHLDQNCFPVGPVMTGREGPGVSIDTHTARDGLVPRSIGPRRTRRQARLGGVGVVAPSRQSPRAGTSACQGGGGVCVCAWRGS